MQRRQAGWGGAIVAAALAVATPASGQGPPSASACRVRVEQAIGGRYVARPAISADGTVVAFESPVSSLVAGDTNAVTDIFVATGALTITRVLGNGGVQPNCASQRASVSADGRFVAFDSCASNLVAGDTNGVSDVFVLDRNTGTVTRVSVSSAEAQANGPSFSSAISPNGQFVAFLSQATESRWCVGRPSPACTCATWRTATPSSCRARPAWPAPSPRPTSVRASPTTARWRLPAPPPIWSPAADTNGVSDVFLRLGATGGTPTTIRVSVSATRRAADLAPRPARRSAPTAQLVAFETAGAAVPGDTNGLTDVYVRDRTGRAPPCSSRGPPAGSGGNGNSFEGALSPNGGFIVFTSQAADLDGAFDAALRRLPRRRCPAARRWR